MKNGLLLSDPKVRWISRIYFHVTATPSYNLHPFANMMEFMNAKVGDMLWGKGENNRSRSKAKFSENLARTLYLYDIQISVNEILKHLSNDKMTNQELIKKLAGTD